MKSNAVTVGKGAMEEFATVEMYLRKGKDKGQKANLRRKCRNNFKFEGGILHYRKSKNGKGGDAEPWRVVIRTEEEKKRILESCHAGVGGIHSLLTFK